MSKPWITTFFISSLLSTNIAIAETKFDIRTTGILSVIVDVLASGNNKALYNSSQKKNAQWGVEVRGQCQDNSFGTKWRIDWAKLVGPSGSETILEQGAINKSLTPNKGKTWEAHTVSGVTIPSNQQPLIDACNAEMQRLVQEEGLSLTQALASNPIIGTQLSYEAKLDTSCKDISGGFNKPNQLVIKTAALPVHIRCKSTGYQPPPLSITQTQLNITTTSKPAGVCKVKLNGQIASNYGNKTINYKYQYRSDQGQSSTIINSQTYQVSTGGGQNGVSSFQDKFNVPIMNSGPESGKIRIMATSPEFVGDWVPFTMDCNKAATAVFQAPPAPPTLSLKITTGGEENIGGQICPTKMRWIAEVKTTDPLEANLLFNGQGYLSLHSIKVYQNSSKKIIEDRDLQWNTASTSIASNTTTAPLKTQVINLGFNLASKTTNEVLFQYPRQDFMISCKAPLMSLGGAPNTGIHKNIKPNTAQIKLNNGNIKHNKTTTGLKAKSPRLSPKKSPSSGLAIEKRQDKPFISAKPQKTNQPSSSPKLLESIANGTVFTKKKMIDKALKPSSSPDRKKMRQAKKLETDYRTGKLNKKSREKFEAAAKKAKLVKPKANFSSGNTTESCKCTAHCQTIVLFGSSDLEFEGTGTVSSPSACADAAEKFCGSAYSKWLGSWSCK